MQRTVDEHPDEWLKQWLALLTVAAMFAAPIWVYLSFLLSYGSAEYELVTGGAPSMLDRLQIWIAGGYPLWAAGMLVGAWWFLACEKRWPAAGITTILTANLGYFALGMARSL